MAEEGAPMSGFDCYGVTLTLAASQFSPAVPGELKSLVPPMAGLIQGRKEKLKVQQMSFLFLIVRAGEGESSTT